MTTQEFISSGALGTYLLAFMGLLTPFFIVCAWAWLRWNWPALKESLWRPRFKPPPPPQPGHIWSSQYQAWMTPEALKTLDAGAQQLAVMLTEVAQPEGDPDFKRLLDATESDQ
jgi:hypothetical protein